MAKYSFSGHETFYCRSLWLKKGYDFIKEGHSFNDPNAVIRLGVGKNMVASIRFWLKAFGLTINDQPTQLADLLFDTNDGIDQFLEDIDSLWLLHYNIIKEQIASLYYLLFVDFQSERKDFDRNLLKNHIKRCCNTHEQKNAYNENTVRKDIDILLKNYVTPTNVNALEDFSAIFLSLNIIQKKDDYDDLGGKETFFFIQHRESEINPSLILYALLDMKGEDNTISFDNLQEIAYIFCLSVSSLIEIIRELEKKYPQLLHYSDNSGIRNVQFLKPLDKYDALKMK